MKEINIRYFWNAWKWIVNSNFITLIIANLKVILLRSMYIIDISHYINYY